MKRICLTTLLALAGCGDDPPASFDAAAAAYSQGRVNAAEAYYRSVADNRAASPGDRIRASRELAYVAWVIDANADRALRLLTTARVQGDDACRMAQLTARILAESGRVARLRGRLDGLTAACPGPDDADSILRHVASAELDAGDAGRGGSRLAAMSAAGQVQPATVTLALRQGVLAGDAPAALRAWRDYFWLDDADQPPALAAAYPAATPVFVGALAPAAPPAAKLRLVDLLVRAGFADAAEQFARRAGLDRVMSGHPIWRRATAYFRIRAALRARILASNRRVARGGDADDLDAAYTQALDDLHRAAGLTGTRDSVLRRAYGLMGRSGDTGGFASVHFGHLVRSDRRVVEQYGERAAFAFASIDNLWSNGFESWLWDGAAATGGWTVEGPAIVQVRQEYLDGPLQGWALHVGGLERDRLAARQAERLAQDRAALAGADVAYLPALSDRLRLQVARQIGERARRRLKPGEDLRRRFLIEYDRVSFVQQMLAHEGRHAIDKRLVRWLARFDDANLEYRAKLSELAFAPVPRLALYNIADRTVGGDTPHGEANAKILRAYAGWIERQPGAVAGYDRAIPAMMQLDRLSDSQLRAIARGLEPLLQR